MSPLSQNPTRRAQEQTSTRASGHEPFVSKFYTKGLQLPGDSVKKCCVLICQLLLDDGFPLQNRSFRHHFLNRKCRSRDSASIGALRAPKFGLRIYWKTARPHWQTKKNSRPFSEPRFPSLAIPNARAHAGIDDAVRDGRRAPPSL